MTLTVTSDDLEGHIVVNVSSDPNKFHYLICGCIVFDSGRTDVQMDVRTDIFTGFIRSSQEMT